MAFRLGLAVDLCMAYNYAHARVDDLDFDARGHSGSAKAKESALSYLDNEASNTEH